MKKILSVAVLALAFSIQAQNINDAMLYAQTNLKGTARFSAMSGAFGALGGDLSSINVNPAGSVVFANNQVGFTLNNSNIKNKSNYFGTNTSVNNNSFDINQAGAVFVFINKEDSSDWKKFAFALNYDNAASFDNSLYSAGLNTSNSIDKYFLSYANGVELQNIDDSYYYYDELYYYEQQAYLGYKSKIIKGSTTNPNNTSYTSNVPTNAKYYQTNTTETTGYNGKLSFNGSANYKDKILIGINLNSHFTDYRKSTSFHESNDFVNTTTDYLVKRMDFYNDLYTYGNGFSFQLGSIFKPTKEVRFGVAYESPTWYKLNDELIQSAYATSGNVNGELAENAANPNVAMIYEPYKLQTPSKWTGSFAYVFGKKGLISLDYAIKDYSKTQFRPKNLSVNENYEMATLLNTSNEFRLGGEYKIKMLSIRGGYRFEQSPYKNGKTIGDLKGYSGGLGYNFGNTKLDLAYTQTQRDSQQAFFSQGLTDAAKINSKNSTVLLTLLFEL